jgi:PadR family transcriptional regulator PadR
MTIGNTESQMRKGLLELCILGIIRKEQEAYPSDILEQLKAARMVVLEGTLYPLLTRLKNAGMLDYRWVESPSGPPRKYYSLTEPGATFYAQLLESWNELRHTVDHITQP